MWVSLITMRQSVVFMFVYHAQGIKITKALEIVNILRHEDICCNNLYTIIIIIIIIIVIIIVYRACVFFST